MMDIYYQKVKYKHLVQIIRMYFSLYFILVQAVHTINLLTLFIFILIQTENVIDNGQLINLNTLSE